MLEMQRQPESDSPLVATPELTEACKRSDSADAALADLLGSLIPAAG
jgi:hypothetical protein